MKIFEINKGLSFNFGTLRGFSLVEKFRYLFAYCIELFFQSVTMNEVGV